MAAGDERTEGKQRGGAQQEGDRSHRTGQKAAEVTSYAPYSPPLFS